MNVNLRGGKFLGSKRQKQVQRFTTKSSRDEYILDVRKKKKGLERISGFQQNNIHINRL